jgi:pimeloyl-ACP methyl ester carboxylesterase
LAAAALLAAAGSARAEHFLISMHGGNGSCGDGLLGQRIHAHTERLQQTLEKAGHKVTIDLTCYERLSYDVHFLDESGQERTLNRTAYSKWLNQRIAGLRPDRIVIVGHSYGGWLSMFLTTRLSPATKVDTLVTVDPISQVYCTIADVLKRFSMYYNQETPKPGCQQAPADMNPDGYRRIAGRSRIWRQYFQARTSPLRSGPIPAASSNHLMYNDGGAVASDAHGLIVDHAQVWARLYADLGIAPFPGIAADEKIFKNCPIRL